MFRVIFVTVCLLACGLARGSEKSAHADLNLARSYHEQKNWALAEKHYLRTIGQGYYVGAAHRSLGNMYYEQGKYSLAENHYQKAINEREPYALLDLGWMYHRQDKDDLAEKYYLQAFEKEGLAASAANYLGLMYEDQKRYDLAERYYSLAIGKGNEHASGNLTRLRGKKAQVDANAKREAEENAARIAAAEKARLEKIAEDARIATAEKARLQKIAEDASLAAEKAREEAEHIQQERERNRLALMVMGGLLVIMCGLVGVLIGRGRRPKVTVYPKKEE
jgi:tetratricopeptide (TPR) repeat protein